MRKCLKYGFYGAGIGLAFWVFSYVASMPAIEPTISSIPVLSQLITFFGSPICALACGYFPATQCQSTCWIAFGAFLNIIVGVTIGAAYGEMNCDHED
jgi:hypothetical protein